MALLNIVTDTDPILTKRSRPVDKVDARTLQLLDDMKETLKAADGAGLAAVQVGILRRIAIVDDGSGPIELINPELIETSGEREVLEGCLSFPGRWALKKRPEKVSVKALDRNGKEVLFKDAEGLLAQAMCHEIEHLDGKVFLDDVVRELNDEEVDEIVNGKNNRRKHRKEK